MSWIDELGKKCVICPFKACALALWRGIRWVFSKLSIIVECPLCPFKAVAKYLWNKLVAFFWRYRWISYVVLTIFAIAAINLIGVHLYYIKFEKMPSSIAKIVPDLLLKIIKTDSKTLIDDGHYSIVIADLIAICAIGFAVLPIIQAVIYKRRLKRELRDEYGFDFVPVKKAGYDDIKEMLKRYKQADEVTIFSGGFDWIHENEDMKQFLLKLAGDHRLRLISFRTYEEVKKCFENKNKSKLFNELHTTLGSNFRFDSKLRGIKCSLIETLGENKLLFRQSSEQHEFNAGFLGSSKYSRQLLGILFKFADVEHRGTSVAVEAVSASDTVDSAAAEELEQD